jgi:riboflavin kinase/FMN adenylyltransferase
VRQILIDGLGTDFLVLGHDHAFGRGRRGREPLLRQLAPELGFDLEVVGAVMEGGEAITSTVIRHLLAAGNVRRAADMLGRPYGMKGLVVRGEGRGRELGCPTANLTPVVNRKCVPGDGIYAVGVRVRGRNWTGACSIGRRPTFGSGDRTIEVHLIDFEDDIYGDSVGVTFHERVRDEIAFDSPEDLIEQMNRDIEDVKRIMSQEEH